MCDDSSMLIMVGIDPDDGGARLVRKMSEVWDGCSSAAAWALLDGGQGSTVPLENILIMAPSSNEDYSGDYHGDNHEDFLGARLRFLFQIISVYNGPDLMGIFILASQ